MTYDDVTKIETRTFTADVAKLLHMMVHAVYSEPNFVKARRPVTASLFVIGVT